MEKEMDEGRKRTLGVIAAIFACRKLAALSPLRYALKKRQSHTPILGIGEVSRLPEQQGAGRPR